MAQGIMTGIGFLGAGVIFKEGANVRGLTTAATVWITSALGILIGIGFYLPAVAGVVATLLVLSGLRWVEARLPRSYHASLWVRFERELALSEVQLREEVTKEGFSVHNLSHRLTGGGEAVEYRATIRRRKSVALDGLSTRLRAMPQVTEYKVMPTGD